MISDKKKCGDLSVGDILRWTVGCPEVPPSGLENKINVHCTANEKYPTVTTCSLDLTITFV